MKVLHVIDRLKEGGITTFVTALVALNRTRRTRHDVLLLRGAAAAVPGARVFCLPGGRLWRLRAVRDVLRHGRAYDVVMVHAAHGIVVLALCLLRKRVFLFQHGMSVSSGSWARRSLKKAWYSVLPVLLRARVVCSTDFAFRKARALGIRLSEKRVVVVPFGTSWEATPHRDSTVPGVLRVGMAGRLVAQKRMGVVLESLAGYAGRRRLSLRIAGEGPEQPHLATLAARLDPDTVDVRFLGHVDDMDAFYADLDLVVFPAREESFGLVVLEALVRHVPVAVFPDVGGCLALVEPGRNGFVVEGGGAGLARLWQQLDAEPDVLAAQRRYLATVDFRPYHIATTRDALDRLARAHGHQRHRHLLPRRSTCVDV